MTTPNQSAAEFDKIERHARVRAVCTGILITIYFWVLMACMQEYRDQILTAIETHQCGK